MSIKYLYSANNRRSNLRRWYIAIIGQIVTYCTSDGASIVSESVGAPSVWNSLSYSCRSAELLSTFKRSLTTELFDIASYCKREHSA